jgi:hypothetical protein
MRIAVFLGPTLSHPEARSRLDAIYLPPAAQGDVYRAAKERPFAIGIIDGYFERLPSVWHKEILSALARGIHVFGGGSMGALRAAELATFGMNGIGATFEAFRSGELEDDDEVAVAHGDASTGYRAISEAMVNIRATLSKADADGAISGESRRRFETIAKSLFYPDRSYPRLFAMALEQGVPGSEVEALRRFVAVARLDQKRADALAVLDALNECAAIGAPPHPVAFSFSHTEAWEQVVDWADDQPPLLEIDNDISADLVAAEVRLWGPQGRAVLAAGLTRAVAATFARGHGALERKQGAEAIDLRMRRSHGRAATESFERWLEERGFTPDEYNAFLERQADLEALRVSFRHVVDRHVVDELRMSGQYSELRRRAHDKESVLQQNGLSEPTLEDAGMTDHEVLPWYCKRLGMPVPDDAEAVLAELAIADSAALKREVLREILYQRLSPSP